MFSLLLKVESLRTNFGCSDLRKRMLPTLLMLLFLFSGLLLMLSLIDAGRCWFPSVTYPKPIFRSLASDKLEKMDSLLSLLECTTFPSMFLMESTLILFPCVCLGTTADMGELTNTEFLSMLLQEKALFSWLSTGSTFSSSRSLLESYSCSRIGSSSSSSSFSMSSISSFGGISSLICISGSLRSSCESYCRIVSPYRNKTLFLALLNGLSIYRTPLKLTSSSSSSISRVRMISETFFFRGYFTFSSDSFI